jgi:hypothetical protein
MSGKVLYVRGRAAGPAKYECGPVGVCEGGRARLVAYECMGV